MIPMPGKKSRTPSSPVPVAGFMPPPPKSKSKSKTKSTASSGARSLSTNKPKPVPTKAIAAKNIAMIGKNLLKLSRELGRP